MESTEFTSPYSPNTGADRRAMLDSIGVDSVVELFEDIPAHLRNPSLDLPAPLSEFELRRDVEAMAAENATPGDYACFLGAGSYRHFVPAIVRQLAGRSEFMTAYTPYQPEVAQGTLQAHYEFQSMVCQLTGMDVANAGMYDGSTSLAEAALMAARTTKRSRIAVLNTVSPALRRVIETYTQAPGLDIYSVSPDRLDLSGDTACLIVQQPGFLGQMEDVEALSKQAHASGALLVVSADPMSLGMFKPPAEYDADIVVGEGQTLGIPPTYGGPYVGLFACKQKYIRQMPGRIVGKTVDTQGREGYVLTLQTREQHIRRERATSNICTSVGLIALMSTVYVAAQGRRGLRHVAELCYHKAHYAASLIEKIPGYSLPLQNTFFREFVVQCPIEPAEINRRLFERKIIGGLDVSDQIPNGMLFCCTEVNTREEIENLAGALSDIGGAK
ncbi:MAG: aminomethyl-transferring glycine dehydrogenase subunit GcvPA [SAR202 cluster bacterium]|jgi:glycine dehydrogenase subunit 1|nr:aminomethyl-transferring glycine dehydrogenase subunit GcvPA [SAR202 cluster bacterium]